MFFLIPLLIVAIFLEGTITTFPLVLICLLCWAIVRRDESVFPAAFFAGIFLDSLTLHTIGGASIFLLIFSLLILLYQRKYEINSYPFVAAASFVGSWIFLSIFGNGGGIAQSFLNTIVGLVIFGISSKFKIKS